MSHVLVLVLILNLIFVLIWTRNLGEFGFVCPRRHFQNESENNSMQLLVNTNLVKVCINKTKLQLNQSKVDKKAENEIV